MVDKSIPKGALWLSVTILVYSAGCLTASTLLAIVLWKQQQRLRYITLVAFLTTLGTFCSVIQQIYYANTWLDSKQHQFENAVASVTTPAFGVGGTIKIASPTDLWLFRIQVYTYNSASLLTLFWAATLYMSSWGLFLDYAPIEEHRIGQVSKIVALVLPAILMGIAGVDGIIHHTLSYVVCTDVTMVITLTGGCLLLALTLWKYIMTRKATIPRSKRLIRTQPKLPRYSIPPNSPGIPLSSVTATYDRGLIIRFAVGSTFLAGFQAANVAYQITQLKNNSSIVSQNALDLSISGTISDLLEFIPGVTVSLIAFFVFGTARNALRGYADIFACLCCRTRARRRTIMDLHQGTVSTTSETERKVEPRLSKPSIGRPRQGNAPRVIIKPMNNMQSMMQSLNKPLPETPLRKLESGLVVDSTSNWMAMIREADSISEARVK